MNNELLNRYCREKKGEPNLYPKYKNFIISPDLLEYHNFLVDIEKYNNQMATTIKNKVGIPNTSDIIETIPTVELYNSNGDEDEIKTVSDFLPECNSKTKIPAYYKTTQDVKIEGLNIDNNSFYISNGIYNVSFYIIRQILANNGSFIIGINTKKKSDFFNKSVLEIKNFQKELHKRGVPITVYEKPNKNCHQYTILHKGYRI